LKILQPDRYQSGQNSQSGESDPTADSEVHDR
jgi:hypothetical protein